MMMKRKSQEAEMDMGQNSQIYIHNILMLIVQTRFDKKKYQYNGVKICRKKKLK